MAHEADEWQLYYTADGHAYYHNHVTGESTWAEVDEVGNASAFSTPSDDVSGSSSWASDDEDRFQSYLLTAEGQQALKIEEAQAEQLLAQRRKRLGHADASSFAFTPRSPKELAEAYSDMDELSEDDSLQVRHQYDGPHVRKSVHQRSGSEGSFYKNGSTLLAASPTAADSPHPVQHYADPRQQFMVSHDDQHSLYGTQYLSHQFEQPEYYDTRSPRSRSHKSSSKRRHRDHKRIRRKPLNFKYSNHFHGDDAGSDVDTVDELSESEDEDLQEILAIDASISKVYNAFAVTGSVFTSCTAHASKWVYDNAAALVSVVYTRTMRELEKLAASEPPARPQAALA